MSCLRFSRPWDELFLSVKLICRFNIHTAIFFKSTHKDRYQHDFKLLKKIAEWLSKY